MPIPHNVSEAMMKFRGFFFAIFFLSCSLAVVARPQAEGSSRTIAWQDYEDQAVRLLQEYIRIDTSNPPGNELAAAEFFHRLFNTYGIPNTVFPYAPGRANIYAVLKGDGTLRPLILLNHMDVVRAESGNWKVPPFSGEILDGELWGRGAVDMKDEGLLQAMVMLIAAREHLPLKRDLIFLATADEEVGSTGSAWMIENHTDLVRGAEYLITEGGANLIYPGRGTVCEIDVAEKASFWLRMTARGPAGHGSIPIAKSAPNRLVRAMSRVVDWQPPIHLLPSVEQYFHQIASLEPEPRASQFRDIRKALKNPRFAKALAEDEDFNYMIRNTVSLTVFKGSAQTNVIPETASCELDVRLLPGEDPQAFLAQLRAVVADEQIEIQRLHRFSAANASSTDTGLYRIIEQVVHRNNPRALVVPELDSGTTESSMYRPLGIICYGFTALELAPEINATEHSPNERVPVEQVRRGVKTLYEIVARTVNE